jgi:carbonic anhydrase/acetyltransferase-like protein (isoleucine patch superfamily)
VRQIQSLIDKIADIVSVNLREHAFSVNTHLDNCVALDKLAKFYAFYGLSPHYPLHFHFHKSVLAGSYFLGMCTVERSVLYKSDIRGDELRVKGRKITAGGRELTLQDDEKIHIKNSFLVKTLVHSNSHDPENPELFHVYNTVALHFANIHGSPTRGVFIGPFATLDQTTAHDCVLGPYAYVNAGEIRHANIPGGHIQVRSRDRYEFHYQHNPESLARFIQYVPGKIPRGILMVLSDRFKQGFQEVFKSLPQGKCPNTPVGSFVSPYAAVDEGSTIGENVLVAQRAYLSKARMGGGSNAQENCFIIDSELEGRNITAHGANVIHAKLGQKVFVGFNSFLNGSMANPIVIGKDSIVTPHTIIDAKAAIVIPPGHMVWGLIERPEDIPRQTLAIEDLRRISGEARIGEMTFSGDGGAFAADFAGRIEHILEANGAYFEGTQENRGHAQKGQDIAYNIIQPFPKGMHRGICPTLDIKAPQ